MTKIEMVEHAMRALGDAKAEVIPLFVASIRDRKRLEALRRERAQVPAHPDSP